MCSARWPMGIDLETRSRGSRRHSAVINDVPNRPGRMRFSHAVIREALYGDLSPPRRRRLACLAGGHHRGAGHR